ncbi:MAG: hypothetical protein FJZ00_03930, partial [Candidatus Sericytochromatia bacterium]|nr:hypothetical protein [Candidatus Tanganyikabacteria bacterium]
LVQAAGVVPAPVPAAAPASAEPAADPASVESEFPAQAAESPPAEVVAEASMPVVEAPEEAETIAG